MDLSEVKRKKLELEARLSQSIFEIIDDAGEVPENISVNVVKSTNIAGDSSVAAVYVEIGFGL